MNKDNFTSASISLELYEWIRANLKEGSSILELGSGSGSHELSKVYQIECVEHDKRWLGVYDNIKYVYAPIENGWYKIDSIKSVTKNYDLLLVDGPPGFIGRMKFLDNLHLFNLNCKIVIDDTHRYDERLMAHKLSQKIGRKSIIINGDIKSSMVFGYE